MIRLELSLEPPVMALMITEMLVTGEDRIRDPKVFESRFLATHHLIPCRFQIQWMKVNYDTACILTNKQKTLAKQSWHLVVKQKRNRNDPYLSIVLELKTLVNRRHKTNNREMFPIRRQCW